MQRRFALPLLSPSSFSYPCLFFGLQESSNEIMSQESMRLNLTMRRLCSLAQCFKVAGRDIIDDVFATLEVIDHQAIRFEVRWSQDWERGDSACTRCICPDALPLVFL